MERLLNFLDGPYCAVAIDFDNRHWARDLAVPNSPGWYFLSTNAPLEVLMGCPLWAEEYPRARNGEMARVRNYRISDRAGRYEQQQPTYWNAEWVYSGLAASLRSRAREHTFADPGTAGLALARYELLTQHQWNFHFIEAERFELYNNVAAAILLKLGEHAWRVKFGWPILCEE